MSEQPEAAVEDLAAHDYQQLLPQFKAKIEELSNRQLKRVTTALVEYPFEGGNPRFSYPQERELFLLGMKIFDCRYVLMKAAFSMKEDQIKAMLNEQSEGGQDVKVD